MAKRTLCKESGPKTVRIYSMRLRHQRDNIAGPEMINAFYGTDNRKIRYCVVCRQLSHRDGGDDCAVMCCVFRSQWIILATITAECGASGRYSGSRATRATTGLENLAGWPYVARGFTRGSGPYLLHALTANRCEEYPIELVTLLAEQRRGDDKFDVAVTESTRRSMAHDVASTRVMKNWMIDAVY